MRLGLAPCIALPALSNLLVFHCSCGLFKKNVTLA